MQEIINNLTQFGPFWAVVFVLLILFVATFWIGVAMMVIRAICRKCHQHKKIHCNYEKMIEMTKANSSCKENVFLSSDLTIRIAKEFCDSFCQNIYYAKLTVPSDSQYIQKTAHIKVNDSEISSSYNLMLVWKARNLQPLTDSNEIERFEIAIGEYIKSIMNTPSAKKLMCVSEFELTVSEPKFCYSRTKSSLAIEVEFKTPNPKYKVPKPKKWY